MSLMGLRTKVIRWIINETIVRILPVEMVAWFHENTRC